MKSRPRLATVSLAIVPVIVGALLKAQTSTGLNLTITPNTAVMSGQNAFVWSQTGSVNPLGSATLVSTGSVWPFDSNGQPEGPVQLSFVLYFNQVDTISLSFTQSDPNFFLGSGFSLANGTITGGTGVYAGATGLLSLNVAYGTRNVSFTFNPTTTGSGTLTVGGKTTALTVTNFIGGGGGIFFTAGVNYFQFANPNGYTLTTGDITATGSLGNATGSYASYGGPPTENRTNGTITVMFDATDSLIFFFPISIVRPGRSPATSREARGNSRKRAAT